MLCAATLPSTGVHACVHMHNPSQQKQAPQEAHIGQHRYSHLDTHTLTLTLAHSISHANFCTASLSPYTQPHAGTTPARVDSHTRTHSFTPTFQQPHAHTSSAHTRSHHHPSTLSLAETHPPKHTCTHRNAHTHTNTLMHTQRPPTTPPSTHTPTLIPQHTYTHPRIGTHTPSTHNVSSLSLTHGAPTGPVGWVLSPPSLPAQGPLLRKQ